MSPYTDKLRRDAEVSLPAFVELIYGKPMNKYKSYLEARKNVEASVDAISFDTCVQAFVNPVKKNKKGKNMFYDIDSSPHTPDERKASYLVDRLGGANERKYIQAAEVFHMNTPTPKTVGEAAEWLKAGRFDMSFKDDEKYNYNTLRYLSFIDPERDVEGHKEFLAELDKAYQETLDKIMIGTPAEGLAALREFEAIEVA